MTWKTAMAIAFTESWIPQSLHPNPQSIEYPESDWVIEETDSPIEQSNDKIDTIRKCAEKLNLVLSLFAGIPDIDGFNKKEENYAQDILSLLNEIIDYMHGLNVSQIWVLYSSFKVCEMDSVRRQRCENIKNLFEQWKKTEGFILFLEPFNFTYQEERHWNNYIIQPIENLLWAFVPRFYIDQQILLREYHQSHWSLNTFIWWFELAPENTDQLTAEIQARSSLIIDNPLDDLWEVQKQLKSFIDQLNQDLIENVYILHETQELLKKYGEAMEAAKELNIHWEIANFEWEIPSYKKLFNLIRSAFLVFPTQYPHNDIDQLNYPVELIDFENPFTNLLKPSLTQSWDPDIDTVLANIDELIRFYKQICNWSIVTIEERWEYSLVYINQQFKLFYTYFPDIKNYN
jgi:hypothetical protein